METEKQVIGTVTTDAYVGGELINTSKEIILSLF